MSQLVNTSLQGKLALITGCTGGIGRATAIVLASRGCSIAQPRRTGCSISSGSGSLRNVRRLHTEVVDTLGHPDILFNNSGATGKVIGPKGNIQDLDIEMFEATWKLNTGSSYLLTQLCVPHMIDQKYGRVIFCSSSSTAQGTGGVIGPHYASSKSALHGLLHWLASRYAADGLVLGSFTPSLSNPNCPFFQTCNAVAPALITDTGMMSNPNPDYVKLIPIGRFGIPDEIASIVELLVSNGYMNNKILVADGGWTPGAF
ncbi:hypothetical protein BD779DRAFT_1545772 [Infundibulicybe gibba]|nr:hypothetical protein BD779DRAFT_1545772 [Infundibulicybe gibba]